MFLFDICLSFRLVSRRDNFAVVEHECLRRKTPPEYRQVRTGSRTLWGLRGTPKTNRVGTTPPARTVALIRRPNYGPAAARARRERRGAGRERPAPALADIRI
ncbi:hypothetical protein EVAR_91420_1 [Eumeta japonica]|uniref:Uncharacterized protein n=1 Tax=Eumeta variegata TaxID=151549 RepID=A0A4C1WZ75_EUMVA|nr:hypothetical protein EVAR_91420_1 [Eumeta japonica]